MQGVMEEVLKSDIHDDLNRYAKLRAWYRYLSFEGKKYLLFPWKGEQPKNPINPEVQDSLGMHWWVWDANFIDEIPIDDIGKDIIMRRPITFNCFLRGLEGDVNNPHLQGWDVIKKNNPNLPKKLTARHSKTEISCFEYARNSHNEQIDKAVKIAMEIHELMLAECPQWLVIRSNGSDGSDRPIAHDFPKTSSEYSLGDSWEDPPGLSEVREDTRMDRTGVRRTQSDYFSYAPSASTKSKLKDVHTKWSDKLSRKKHT
jgi:hypothetical protein